MREERISWSPHSPGQGGWPTLRYFNKSTGPDGRTYEQKTKMRVCEEMKDLDNMVAWVEDKGRTSLCSVVNGVGCDDVELALIEELSQDSDHVRLLSDMVYAGDVSPNANKKRKILRQMIAQARANEEL